MHILLAEDNPVNQKVALRMLERIGFSAEVANNGVEALAALEQKRYDVILMDMQMPEMDGLEATRQIVAKYPEPDRPYIIALTANAMQGDRERCLAAGMNDYISKPIRMEDLHEAFDRCPIKAVDNADEEKAGESGLVNFDVLDELITMLGNDIDFAGGLINDFLEDAQELLGNISGAHEGGDAREMERAAHTLKSSSATFGATEASDLCKQLEAIGKSGNMDNPETPGLISKLETVLKTVGEELVAYIERQTA